MNTCMRMGGCWWRERDRGSDTTHRSYVQGTAQHPHGPAPLSPSTTQLPADPPGSGSPASRVGQEATPLLCTAARTGKQHQHLHGTPTDRHTPQQSQLRRHQACDPLRCWQRGLLHLSLLLQSAAAVARRCLHAAMLHQDTCHVAWTSCGCCCSCWCCGGCGGCCCCSGCCPMSPYSDRPAVVAVVAVAVVVATAAAAAAVAAHRCLR
jgi:hypothetical protein